MPRAPSISAKSIDTSTATRTVVADEHARLRGRSSAAKRTPGTRASSGAAAIIWGSTDVLQRDVLGHRDHLGQLDRPGAAASSGAATSSGPIRRRGRRAIIWGSDNIGQDNGAGIIWGSGAGPTPQSTAWGRPEREQHRRQRTVSQKEGKGRGRGRTGGLRRAGVPRPIPPLRPIPPDRS